MSDKLVVLVTGANQGLGFAAAWHLAQTGNHIVLVGSRNEANGTKAVQSILHDPTISVAEGSVEPLQLDLASDDSIQAATKTVQEKYGRLDVVRCSRPMA